MNEITEEDLNWFYYGNIENQMIAKLTNEIDPLKYFLSHIIIMSNLSKTQIIKNLLDEVIKKEDPILPEMITNEQIERLKILGEKYKLINI